MVVRFNDKKCTKFSPAATLFQTPLEDFTSLPQLLAELLGHYLVEMDNERSNNF